MEGEEKGRRGGLSAAMVAQARAGGGRSRMFKKASARPTPPRAPRLTPRAPRSRAVLGCPVCAAPPSRCVAAAQPPRSRRAAARSRARGGGDVQGSRGSRRVCRAPRTQPNADVTSVEAPAARCACVPVASSAPALAEPPCRGAPWPGSCARCTAQPSPRFRSRGSSPSSARVKVRGRVRRAPRRRCKGPPKGFQAFKPAPLPPTPN